ncbi:MAG: type 2 isopentenyl-diphosphate Delta-isomerase [Chloroflexota bacterium]
MGKVTATPRRKADHIRLNLEADVQSGLTTGLERYRFEHLAAPELDLRQVDTRQTFLDHPLQAPLLISSMTGGTSQAEHINLALAEAAQAAGVAMGLGSLRAAIEDPALARTFRVRQVAPDILLFANLGAVQLNYGYGLDECRRAVDLVGADALMLHLNPLQEALQPEGDVDFAGLLAKIALICRGLGKPVIAKEVGWGISPRAARLLAEAGVAAIDVAGAGGTSWSQVEMHRAASPTQARVAAAFVHWGIPTADAILAVRAALPSMPLIASGGLRSGIDVAKCLALGADLCGMAGPFLKAAAVSSEAVKQAIEQTILELRLCLFLTGAKDIAALRTTPLHEVA